MQNEVLMLIQNLDKLVQENLSFEELLKKIFMELKESFGSDILFLDKTGKIIAFESALKSLDIFAIKPLEDGTVIEKSLNNKFLSISETKTNMTGAELLGKKEPKSPSKKVYLNILPINSSDDRIATLVFSRNAEEFIDEDSIHMEWSKLIISYIMKLSENEQNAEDRRKINIVKSAVSTLSYSELEAISHVFDELGGDEGLLVASKVADRAGITRSVIVNALRKLESAGLIESRSLGMKGTYIKILNNLLLEEIKKNTY